MALYYNQCVDSKEKDKNREESKGFCNKKKGFNNTQMKQKAPIAFIWSKEREFDTKWQYLGDREAAWEISCNVSSELEQILPEQSDILR